MTNIAFLNIVSIGAFIFLLSIKKLSVIAGAVFISPHQGDMQRRSPSFAFCFFFMIPYWFQMHYKACIGNTKCLSVVHSLWIKGKEDILLNHIIIVELGPLKDVLLAHNVWVDEKVTITHAEVLLAGSALEALQMVNLVPHTHRHLECSDPLFTGSAETVLAKKPEVISPTQFSSQLVVEPTAHLPQPTATQITAQAVLVPVLLNGLQEESVTNALLTSTACQQRWRHLEDLIHRFLAGLQRLPLYRGCHSSKMMSSLVHWPASSVGTREAKLRAGAAPAPPLGHHQHHQQPASGFQTCSIEGSWVQTKWPQDEKCSL